MMMIIVTICFNVIFSNMLTQSLCYWMKIGKDIEFCCQHTSILRKAYLTFHLRISLIFSFFVIISKSIISDIVIWIYHQPTPRVFSTADTSIPSKYSIKLLKTFIQELSLATKHPECSAVLTYTFLQHYFQKHFTKVLSFATIWKDSWQILISVLFSGKCSLEDCRGKRRQVDIYIYIYLLYIRYVFIIYLLWFFMKKSTDIISWLPSSKPKDKTNNAR